MEEQQSRRFKWSRHLLQVQKSCEFGKFDAGSFCALFQEHVLRLHRVARSLGRNRDHRPN